MASNNTKEYQPYVDSQKVIKYSRFVDKDRNTTAGNGSGTGFKQVDKSSNFVRNDSNGSLENVVFKEELTSSTLVKKSRNVPQYSMGYKEELGSSTLFKKGPNASQNSMGFQEELGSSTLVKKGMNVSQSSMRDVVGFKQTIINNINPRSKDYKKPPRRPPKRSDWRMLMKRQRKEDSWIYPFPWDPNIRLAPEDFFIQLSMAEMDRTGQVDLGYVIELEQLFEPAHEGVDRPEHILIRGDAGFGKSTLCTKIAFDWARNVLTFAEFPTEESLVLLYRLKDLPPLSDLEEELRSFAHSYYTAEDSSISNMQRACADYGNKLLVILDGYDEICPEHQEQVRDFLSCKDHSSESFFKLASIIVTSRPDTDKELLYLFDKHYRLTGLSEERRLKLVSSFLRHNTACANSVLGALNNYEDPCTKNLSPLLILIICYIAKQDGFEVMINEDQLSLHCIHLMAKRCNEREGFGFTEEDINLKLHELGRLFYKCLSNNTLYLRASDMRIFLKEHYDFAVQFGLLRNSFQSDNEKKKEVFEPIHKLFMEALAKQYLLEAWRNHKEEERLAFVNEFVDSLSAQIYLIQDKDPEYQVRIIAKDRMFKGNRIIYLWELDPVTGKVCMTFDKTSPVLIDLSIKVTTNDPLDGDIDFFVNYITNAFSGVANLKNCLGFLSLFKQHIHRVKFCRSVDKNSKVNEHRVNSIFYSLDNYLELEHDVLFLPWSSLTEKVNLVEVELGEALLKTSTISFVCQRLLGFIVKDVSYEENARDVFLNLFQSLHQFHDRFYIKCELKSSVGGKMYRMLKNRKKKKVHLITFQCNYKHEHTHPMELEVGINDKDVPKFDWNNIHSVIMHFSK